MRGQAADHSGHDGLPAADSRELRQRVNASCLRMLPIATTAKAAIIRAITARAARSHHGDARRLRLLTAKDRILIAPPRDTSVADRDALGRSASQDAGTACARPNLHGVFDANDEYLSVAGAARSSDVSDRLHDALKELLGHDGLELGHFGLTELRQRGQTQRVFVVRSRERRISSGPEHPESRAAREQPPLRVRAE